MSQIEQTYKSKDTEEYLDRKFFRPVGYAVAVVSAKLKLTPNALTIIGIILGIISGHLFYYNAFWINITGVLIFIFADILDSADGQLARMTKNFSKTGRVFDGFATNLIFVSVYLHLVLKTMVNYDLGYWVFIIGLVSGASHSVQAAIADYFRQLYLYVVYEKGELDNSENIKEQYKSLSWSKNFFTKFLLLTYIDYTKRQELVSGKNLILIRYIKENYEVIPDWLKAEYRKSFKSMNKYHNFLTVNSRTIMLSISVLLNFPVLYFFFEIVFLNVFLILVLNAQTKKSEKLLEKIKEEKPPLKLVGNVNYLEV